MSANEEVHDNNLINLDYQNYYYKELREQKNKSKIRKLGASIYKKGKEREAEGKMGGAFLTKSGRMINRAGQEEDKGKIRKTAESLLNPKRAIGKASKMGSRRMLRWAWELTFSVYGFLIGIPYINIHAFSRFLFPELVCALGEEWTGGAGGKTINYLVKWGEIILLFFLDVLFLLLIVLIFLIIYMIMHPIKTFLKMV